MAAQGSMADKWDREIPVPAHVIGYVDPGVRKKLPVGTTVHSISPSGKSFWARTAKIEATGADGTDTPFFIKVNQFQHGRNMISSEFASMTKLHSIMPEMVPEPIAWGAYEEEDDIYFFVCRFVTMSGDIPDVGDFPALLAKMHQRGASADGEFGLPYVTYSGRNPQFFPPSRSWEECFTLGIKAEFELEERTHGPDEEMRRLRDGVLAIAIPRLLRPLETEGRTLVPTLVHGDLWDGNASVDTTTGHPVIYDAVPIYAHNEYDLGPWWAPRHRMTSEYINKYSLCNPPSEPADDFEGRGLLYRLRFDLHASSLYPGSLKRRGLVMDTMRELLARYPHGYEEYSLDHGLSPDPLTPDSPRSSASPSSSEEDSDTELLGFDLPCWVGEPDPLTPDSPRSSASLSSSEEDSDMELLELDLPCWMREPESAEFPITAQGEMTGVMHQPLAV
ncbi:hypothetical protein MAPG_09442 [Magnaporthiopsis poae ATCC 64411]|uniref:protein-ribulosamine 3-kinase n=1 Tax=Magnaporthiopsis poae (strain ATCC 64411 / 73-15) TaxID=644358 RepID=A0A0C4E9Z0_MAGP6|nr:hypothetical protein MAPG_09442 [Magnaporthiopsis poae ATCC 64411]